MGIAMNMNMNMNSRSRSTPRRGSLRKGISLLEVIACTAIIAVMIVPIAGVIRASGRAIGRASQPTSTDSVRDALRWTRDAVRSGQVLDIQSRSLTLILASGQKVEIISRSGQLLMSDGRAQTVLMENVDGVEFSPIRIAGATSPTGVSIVLATRDSETGNTVKMEAVVSLAAPPIQS